MPSSAKLEEFSDRELLHVLNDAGGGNGGVRAVDIASRIHIARPLGFGDQQYAAYLRRCVSIRFSWMKRLSGTVERKSVNGETVWELTEAGQAVVRAKLERYQEQTLAGVNDVQALHALAMLGSRYMKTGRGAANLMRREWLYATHPKRGRR